MPRSLIYDPDKVTSGLLFGTALEPVSLTELSKRSGISISTLSDYKRKPARITLDRLALIANIRGLSDEEVVRLIRAYRGRK